MDRARYIYSEEPQHYVMQGEGNHHFRAEPCGHEQPCHRWPGGPTVFRMAPTCGECGAEVTGFTPYITLLQAHP